MSVDRRQPCSGNFVHSSAPEARDELNGEDATKKMAEKEKKFFSFLISSSSVK